MKREFEIADMIGRAVTVVLLAILHKDLTAMEIITFWVAIRVVSTGTAWWGMDAIRKAVNAWQSIHGTKGNRD